MSEPTPSSSATRPPFQTAAPGPITPSGTPIEVPPAAWDWIVQDVAARSGVDAEPTVVSAEAVTWTSGALGCPKPGMSYTQSMVDGMRVVVTVDGQTYDYRFGRGDTGVLCEA